MGRKRKKRSSLSQAFFWMGILYFGVNYYMDSQSTNSYQSAYPQTKKVSKKYKASKHNDVNLKWPAELLDTDKVSEKLTQQNYYIVFDGSGSMTGRNCAGGSTKEKVAKKALTNFINKIDDKANIGLYIFDGRNSNERVSLGTNNRDSIINQITVSKANGGTPLKSAITTAVNRLSYQAAKQLEYGEYHLVVITDGEAGGRENPEYIVDAALEKTPIIIHTVGFCINKNHSLNQPGRVLYKSANNPQDLQKGLDSILAESEDFTITDF